MTCARWGRRSVAAESFAGGYCNDPAATERRPTARGVIRSEAPVIASEAPVIASEAPVIASAAPVIASEAKQSRLSLRARLLRRLAMTARVAHGLIVTVTGSLNAPTRLCRST